ncbi:entericidin [Rhodobacter sp. KR11]|jgi:predicted small secreted protein|nr:entericidin [Rhodobacter sp. KR11]MCW1919369.1 entericidin [Rhodobacter sp. KR11]
MKKLILVAILAALAGCNTISGVGMDISGSANRVGGWMGGGG